MKASAYKAKLLEEENNKRANRHLPEIPMYQKLTKMLWDALQGDKIWPMMQALGLDKMDETRYKAEMEGETLKVTEKVTPYLYKLFNGIKERLGMERPVDFFIVSNNEVNAYARLAKPLDPNTPLTIVVYSGTIELLTEAELSYVVGHELGHLMDENLVLQNIFNFEFPDNNIPIPLMFKYYFWRQLSELFADRYGYLATKDLNACISAQFKLKSGLKLDKMEVDMNAFLEYNREVLQHYISGQVLNLISGPYARMHPVSPIRVEALNLFANAQTEKELNDGMQSLVEIIGRLNVDNNMGKSYMDFVASAGLLLAEADGEITKEEIEVILNYMSDAHLFPKSYLEEMAKKDCYDVFNRSVNEILQKDPNAKERLFLYMADVVVSDLDFNKKELDILTEVAQKVFQFDQTTFLRLMQTCIEIRFRPTTESISGI